MLYAERVVLAVELIRIDPKQLEEHSPALFRLAHRALKVLADANS